MYQGKDNKMYTKEQIDNIIKETQLKDNLNSPRQVLEKYPDLEAIYNMVHNQANIPSDIE